MRRIGSGFLLTFLILFSLSCNAMDSSDRRIFNGAEAAFAACNNFQGVHVLNDGHVICLRGLINSTMFINLMKLKNEIRKAPYVIISGPGGDVDSSIYIVRLLDKFNPTPVAGDMCASACAQFLFLMGRHRVMLHCADVAIHGGPYPVDKALASNFSNAAKQRLIETTWRFIRFYRHRHVSIQMLIHPPKFIQHELDKGEIVFWPWSIDKLRSFGVHGIISNNDPSEESPPDFMESCVPHQASHKNIDHGAKSRAPARSATTSRPLTAANQRATAAWWPR